MEHLNKAFSQSKKLNVTHDPNSIPGRNIITDHDSHTVTKLLSFAERIPELEASQKKNTHDLGNSRQDNSKATTYG